MRIVIAGGGASGVFAALQCRGSNNTAAITILEKSDRLLAKVLLSGGGRCNLSHAAPDDREFISNYPRGSHFLRTAFSRFGPGDTVAWFKGRDVILKTEPDGRVFPASDRSETVVECLTEELRRLNISVRFGCGLQSAGRSEQTGLFTCRIENGAELLCERLCIATGGNREGRDSSMLSGLGHQSIKPVPSLFTFVIPDRRISGIPGVSVHDSAISIPKTRFSERGPLLVTHRGLSGPAVLRLSAFAARYLHECDYRADLAVNWYPSSEHRDLLNGLKKLRTTGARSLIFARTPFRIPLRLWQSLAEAAGCTGVERWADLTKRQVDDLAGQLFRSTFSITGMDSNKAEFVTCGGVDLGEVDARTMRSRIHDGLFFCGEALDIDGVTGGFNLQAAWTTGWIAGEEMGK